MRAKRANTRAGLTLIEVVTAMTVMTTVLGLSVALIAMLLKLSDSGHRHASDEAALMRAARLFREDVRAAAQAVPEGGGKRLWLGSVDGGSVEYSASREGLMRVAMWDDDVIKQERLPLPPKSSPRFEVDRNVVALLLDRRQPGSTDRARPRVLRIEAAPGARERFTASGGGTR